MYRVIRNGNINVSDYTDLKRAMKRAEKIATKGDYVEIWESNNGFEESNLLKYWN